MGNRLSPERVRPWIEDQPQAVDVRFNRSGSELLKRDLENVCSFFAGHSAAGDPAVLAHNLWERYQQVELQEIMRSECEAVRRFSPCHSILLRASCRPAPTSQTTAPAPISERTPHPDHLKGDQLSQPGLPERCCHRSCTQRGLRPRYYVSSNGGNT